MIRPTSPSPSPSKSKFYFYFKFPWSVFIIQNFFPYHLSLHFQYRNWKHSFIYNTHTMGKNLFEDLVMGPKVQANVVEDSFEHLPTIENYYYHKKGSLFPTYGHPVEIKLRIPPGNFEIEAITRLYSNNEEKVHYGCYLYFFLGESERNVWEGGEIGESIHTTPHLVQIKAMASFNTSKDIRFRIGTGADKAFMAENASLFVRRIGSISYKAK